MALPYRVSLGPGLLWLTLVWPRLVSGYHESIYYIVYIFQFYISRKMISRTP
jgi:hypothetical protein